MVEINDATERLEEITDQILECQADYLVLFWGIGMMRLEDIKAGALIQGIEPGVVIDFLEFYAHTERASLCECIGSRGQI